MNNIKSFGIFGGTFNPPHIGHLLIAKKIKQELNIDRIFFVPSYLPPHKNASDIADASHRQEMVKLLIESEPSFILSGCEIDRKNVCYSVDTIKFFRSEFPGKEIYFIAGSDAFYYIDTWKDYAGIMKLTSFVVYERKGFDRVKVSRKFPEADNVKWISGELINIASSDIRMRIRAGEDCTEEVGKKVSQYIEKNSLYK